MLRKKTFLVMDLYNKKAADYSTAFLCKEFLIINYYINFFFLFYLGTNCLYTIHKHIPFL